MTLGERLKKARDKKGLSQIVVKAKTGINNKTLSGYERGISEPDFETIKMLADLYEVPVSWLIDGNESYDYKNDGTLSPELKDLLNKLSALPEEKQKEVIRMAELLVHGMQQEK